MKRGKSHLETGFLRLWQTIAKNAPQPQCEYQFDPDRRWRFDFAWVRHLVSVEIEGGIWAGGGHGRGVIYTKNCEKYNAATCAGWKVLRYTTKDLEDRPVQCIEEVVWLLGVVPQVTSDYQVTAHELNPEL